MSELWDLKVQVAKWQGIAGDLAKKLDEAEAAAAVQRAAMIDAQSWLGEQNFTRAWNVLTAALAEGEQK